MWLRMHEPCFVQSALYLLTPHLDVLRHRSANRHTLINPHFEASLILAVKQNHDVVHLHELHQHAEHAFFQTVRPQGIQWHFDRFSWS